MNYRRHREWFALSTIAPLALCASTAWAQPPAAGPQPEAPPAETPQQGPSPPATPAPPAPEPAPPAQPEPAAEEPPPPPKFLKEPASTMFGKFKVTLINFIEFDAFHDSTESYQDGYGGSGPIARSNVYAGTHGRTNFTARNTQFGMQVDGPDFSGLKPSGHCRIDFNGQIPGTPQNGNSESGLQNSPTARLFHCYGKLETPWVDLLGGLTYNLFGNQPYFFTASLTFLGIPGEIFTRTAQLRLSHEFKSAPVTVFVGAAAARPPQRNSEIPEGVAALRLMFNDWKGVRTIGAVGTKVDPLAIGVSGTVRQFHVQEQALQPTHFNNENGAGISVDALIPIIPAKSLADAGNSLTATGSFTTGYGIGDEWLGVTGGVGAQSRPAATGAPPYAAAPPQLDIDPGFAVYDTLGNLHAVDWQSINFGLQYYLPGPGNVWLYGNYTYLKSDNIAKLVPPPAQFSTIFKNQTFLAGGVFWAVVPNFQIAVEYSNLRQTFLDEGEETNHRFSLATYYVY
jgi:hypothetical protein